LLGQRLILTLWRGKKKGPTDIGPQQKGGFLFLILLSGRWAYHPIACRETTPRTSTTTAIRKVSTWDYDIRAGCGWLWILYPVVPFPGFGPNYSVRLHPIMTKQNWIMIGLMILAWVVGVIVGWFFSPRISW
jgi:hypothetical protein